MAQGNGQQIVAQKVRGIAGRTVDFVDIGRQAKELGMGLPPPPDSGQAATCLAGLLCNEENRFDVVESSEWTVDFPVLDVDVDNILGPTIDVFSTPNGQPPAGVTGAYNTLSVPGMPNSNMILWGLLVRFSVEAEGRLIRGGYWIPPNGVTVPVPMPDVISTGDSAVLYAGGNTPLMAELLTGYPSWRVAYDMAMGFGLNWLKEHQVSLIRQPLKGLAMIQPFSGADAAGTAFASNLDRINAYNARTASLGFAPAGTFLPVTHKRLGSFAGYAAGAQGPDLPVSREEDASPTIWGGLQAPQNPFAPSPLIFTTPMFWPRAAPMSIQFEVLGNAGAPWQADAQRWLSITGGTNGAAGQDLNLPISSSISGVTSAPAFEQSLDPVPVPVASAMNTNRMIGKLSRMSWFVGLLGKRVPQHWMKCVGEAVRCGAIQAPMGYGELAHYVDGH